MAEIMLRTENPKLKVSSAGLGALVGNPADPYTVETLQSHGFKDCKHKARQINEEIVKEADLLIVLEQEHSDELLRRFPFARGKVHLLGKWNDNEDISDPYKHPIEAFEKVYDRVRENLDLWVKKADL